MYCDFSMILVGVTAIGADESIAGVVKYIQKTFVEWQSGTEDEE